jgi:cytochrome c oxidase cbb3-type subunit 1
MIPHIYKTKIYSIKLANLHFWLVFVGQLMFSITMWIAGLMQGAMWRATDPDGSLTYSFLETYLAIIPYWNLRTISGFIFLAGFLVFIYNIAMTVRNSGNPVAQREVA